MIPHTSLTKRILASRASDDSEESDSITKIDSMAKVDTAI
jgi:hypothetical protein